MTWAILLFLTPLVLSAPVKQHSIKPQIEVTQNELFGSYEIVINTPYYQKHETVENDGTIYGECVYKLKDESITYYIDRKSFVFVAKNSLKKRENKESDNAEKNIIENGRKNYQISSHLKPAVTSNNKDRSNLEPTTEPPTRTASQESKASVPEDLFYSTAEKVSVIKQHSIKPQVKVIENKVDESYEIVTITPYYEKHEEVEKDGTVIGVYIYKLKDEAIHYAFDSESFVFVTQSSIEEHENEGTVKDLEIYDIVENDIIVEDGEIDTLILEESKNDSVFRPKRRVAEKSHDKEQDSDQNALHLETDPTSNDRERFNLEPRSTKPTPPAPTDTTSQESKPSIQESLSYSTEKVPVISVPDVEHVVIDFAHIKSI